MPGAITKATLLEMIRAEHANLNALLDELDDGADPEGNKFSIESRA